MLGPVPSVRAFVYDEPCDMRKQARGLMAIVEGRLGSDPRSGDVYLFLNRRRDMVKVLFWDQTGICVLCKRLDDGRFDHDWSGEPDCLTFEVNGKQMFAFLSGIRASKNTD